MGRLVISRREGERVQIGDAVLTVVRVGRHTVSLGFDAERHIPIFRSELLTPNAAPGPAPTEPTPGRDGGPR